MAKADPTTSGAIDIRDQSFTVCKCLNRLTKYTHATLTCKAVAFAYDMQKRFLFRKRGFYAFNHSLHLYHRSHLLLCVSTVGAGRQQGSHNSAGLGLSKFIEGLLPKNGFRMPDYVDANELPNVEQPRPGDA